MPRAVAYIISAYPDFHETFVAREVEAMLRRGAGVSIYSLKPSPESAYLYPDHVHLVRYLPFLMSVQVLRRAVTLCLCHPLRAMKAAAWILSSYWNRPLELCKVAAIVPKVLAIAFELKQSEALLHAHWATIPTTAAVIIQIMTGRPFSFTAHAWDIYLTPRRELERKIRLARGVATCTRSNVHYLRSLVSCEHGSKIHLNYHGVEISGAPRRVRQLRRPSELLKIIAVGRLVEQKGFSYLIEALAKATAAGAQMELVLIGDGPLEQSLRNLAHQLLLTDRIHFRGRVSHSQTMEIMESSHVLVAPSVVSRNGDRDGIPNVILEAMSCGLPIVGSNVSGLPEVVKPGSTGFLVPPGDSPALCTALTNLYSDPILSNRLGTNARRLAIDRFDININIGEFFLLLEEMHFNAHKSNPSEPAVEDA